MGVADGPRCGGGGSAVPRRKLKQLYRAEFTGYGLAAFRADVLAGLTVAAVALPLALAFGVASGATAAAGLVTAIAGGLVIGALSGAPYQISGPTGAMSAVLIVLAERHGLPGLWVAGLLSGVLLLAIGLLGLGRFIAFVPEPVVAGFTSGIALLIAIGQLDAFLGVDLPVGSAAERLIACARTLPAPDAQALVTGGLVITTMLVWPRRWSARVPASLVGIVLATGLAAICRWRIAVIGNIPQTLLLDDRLRFGDIPWQRLADFALPALSITALGAVESLLCGTVASNMTGIRLAANQELVAQGAGNMLLPFLGGVPATAAIARSSVGVKSGGRTRLTGIVHALVLLASMFALAPIMSRVPLAALAGVLMVTAWRMNDWASIRFIFGRRFKTAMVTFAVTLVATVALDLTQAIVLGAFLSGAVFLNQIASIRIHVEEVDREKLRRRGIEMESDGRSMRVGYLTGPLFFAAVSSFNEAFAHLEGVRTLVLSMRGVPLVDTSGVQALAHLLERLEHQGGELYLAALHPPVESMLERAGLLARLGRDRVFWSADQAIHAADRAALGGARSPAPTP
jgi:SulP family sulfate permease